MVVTWFLLVVLVLAVVLVVALTPGALTRSGSGATRADFAQLADQALITRSTRRRNLIALGVAAVFVVTGFAVDAARPGLYGLPVMLAPGAAAIAAVVVIGLFPARRPARRAARRAADLTVRRPWSYGPRWAFTLPLLGAATVVVFALLTGMTSSVSEDGHFRSLSLRPGASSGPYPGWFYGVPLIVMTVLLVGATFFALGRTASAPRPSDPALSTTDLKSREQTTRVIMKVSAGALLGYFGGVAFFAGAATRNASTVWDEAGAVFLRMDPFFALGLVEIVLGLLFGLLGITLVLQSVFDALGPPSVRAGSTALPANPATGEASR